MSSQRQDRTFVHGYHWTVSHGLITAGVIFTNGSTRHWNDLLAPFRREGESKSLYPVIGADILSKLNLQRVLPRAFRNTSQSSMNALVAALLRVRLNPPDLAHYDDDPLVLDASQSALVYSEPGPSGYRRVKARQEAGKVSCWRPEPPFWPRGANECY